jgi:hypothetical protein
MGYSAAVVFIESPGESASWKNQAELACRFYGLETEVLVAGGGGNSQQTIGGVLNEATFAVITNAKTLSSLDRKQVLNALRRPRGGVPLLILGIRADTDRHFLNLWSTGGVVAGIGPVNVSSAASFNVANLSGIGRQLAGQALPFSGGAVHALDLNQASNAQAIVRIQNGDHDLPIFVSAHTAGQEVFFQSEYEPCNAVGRENLLGVFPRIAPILMFVRYVAGDRAWHSIGHYANLTIDDPWLTEPYGNLSYEGLLRKMQQYNFHTTIAFIPWNFDRSKPDVVSLFRGHSDKYSVCIHGNNHDHQEFYEYRREPLSNQRLAIGQAIARMEIFKTRTGIPYDRVMVWPHEVLPPAPTLAALKEYNFLGSVNVDAIPLGSKRPDDPLFLLRAEHLSFEGALAIKRIPAMAGSLRARIAINAFLENPILLYAHQDLFANGIGAFDDTATFVNRIQPDTVWDSLEDIVRHHYLVKLREDGNYDLTAFSSQLTLENPWEHDVTFFVEKRESFTPPIKSLTVGGESHPYQRSGDLLLFKVPVSAKQVKQIMINYRQETRNFYVDVYKSSVRIDLLRRMSDFRDLWVSRSRVGAAFIRLYYRTLFAARRRRVQSRNAGLSMESANGSRPLSRLIEER